MTRNYQYYKEIFEGQPMPYAFVDLDLFDANAFALKQRAGYKKVRIASKSVRCVALLKRILDFDEQFQGLMTFTAPETVFLSEQGFDDLLLAYPCWHEQHIQSVAEEVKKGKLITLMVDSPEHVQRINSIGAKLDVIMPICIDVDMSSEFPGIHFGVHRSSINGVKPCQNLLNAIKANPFVRLDGIMGYEAQIAGLGDNVKGKAMMNRVIRNLKKRSIKEIATRRAMVVEMIEAAGMTLRFVNGGGTGSLETTRMESVVTEVTVGSGFYSSGLFDHYEQFHHAPSAVYAIEITRKPKKHIYTCSGGGYIASGAVGSDKAPIPYLPKGIALTSNEGAGEVQTPIVYKGTERLSLGDPVFLRHSKAGELCERFNELLLVAKGEILDRVPTYRGQGMCFL